MTDDATNSQSVNDENLSDLRDENKARWFATSVEIFEHPILDRGPYDRRSAFQWLIANASWKDKRVSHKGSPITLARGQVIIGRAFLAKQWRWSEQMVRTFINQLVAEDMLKINQSAGHFANVATICNYEKYQTRQPERSQQINQSPTRAQPEPNQTLTKTTSYTNNSDSTFLSEAAREKKTGFDYWSNAISPKPDPAVHAHVGVTMEGSKITLHNGTKALWLDRFGGNEERLQLALEQAAGYVQPNGYRPLEAQVGAQLARFVAERMDRSERAQAKAAQPVVSAARKILNRKAAEMHQ